MIRHRLLVVILLVLALMASLLIRHEILGGVRLVKLPSDSLGSSVTTSLKNPSSNYFPIEGIDYIVDSTKYFDGRSWAVVSIKPIGTFSDPGKVVFKVSGDSYQKVLGPSNFFQASELSNLPSDVAEYLEAGK